MLWVTKWDKEEGEMKASGESAKRVNEQQDEFN